MVCRTHHRIGLGPQQQRQHHRLNALQRRAKRTVDSSWEQLETLRHSTSWKLTAPIRLAKGNVRGALR